MNKHPYALTRAAIIAALYAALTLLFSPMSFGPVQMRLSESLMLLPALLPEAAAALTVGCLLSSVLGGATALDVLFGTLATLLSALLVRALRRRPRLAALMPVLVNGVIVGAVIHIAYAPGLHPLLCMLSVAAGELVPCCVLGPAALRALSRIPQKMLHG